MSTSDERAWAVEHVRSVMEPVLFKLSALSLTWGKEGAWHLVEREVRAALRSLDLEERLGETHDRWMGKRQPPETGGYWQ